MKTTVAATLLAIGIMMGSNTADASYTVARPIDNLWGNLFDHSYSV